MTITIDGKSVSCLQGEYILDVAERAGIHIPSLCHHEGLDGLNCCRICIVEVETGVSKTVVAACAYPVSGECAVFTDSERIRRHRKKLLALLHARVPESQEISRLCEEYGVEIHSRLTARDENGKCILCALCVKACESLGTSAISTVNRGTGKRISTPYDEPSLVCVGCGSCAAVCPTGAIEMTEDALTRTIWNKAFNIAKCKRCGASMGTAFENYRAANRAGMEPAEICIDCRKKSMTDIMSQTYGR